jgi:dihydropyrimidinase
MVVWENGEVKTERGRGRYIDRPCFAPYWSAQNLRNTLAEPSAVER